MIAYKSKIKNLITELDTKNEFNENKWIMVGNDIAKIKIGVVYMPGENERKEEMEKAYSEIGEEIEMTKHNENIIICGDFNAKLKPNES